VLGGHPNGATHAIMAGVHPAAPIKGVGCSLVELAAGSRLLDTDDGCELGHLLYSVAHLGFEPSTQFGLHTEVVDLNRLVEMAVDAHRDGHFKVCRKFHLTEGLCAVARKIPGLERHRASAEGFLAGQLDLLPVFAAALFGARQARERCQPVADGSVVACLRESLAIGGFIENHFYLAGHLIELATLATSFGYTVTDGQWAAIRFVVDELDALLPEYLPHVSLPGCFLHFGHYRRAITLLAELVNGASLDRYSRARFTSDFERPSAGTAGDHDPTATAKPSGVYAVARSDRQMRSELSAVVQAYRSIAARGLEPRGDAAHFRRVLVDGWPRWLHFELLDYGSGVIADARRTSGIGVELHLERQDHEFFEVLGRVAASLAGSTRLRNVESDPGWWGGAGRLRAWFEDSTPPETTARALDELIRTTVPILAPEISYRFPRTTAP